MGNQADFGVVFRHEKLEKPMNEGKQMTAVTRAGAPTKIEWHAINWHHVYSNVNRLQSRIVKAMNFKTAFCEKDVTKGLSGVRLTSHAPF